MAMFYFAKRLAALRIITEPCADCILLFGCFSVLLHHTLPDFINAPPKL